MTRRALLLFLLLLSLPAGAKGKAKPKATPRATASPLESEILPDEMLVWATVLQSQFADPKKTTALVSRTATDSNRGHADLWKALRYLRIEMPDLASPVNDDFQSRNAQGHAIPGTLSAKVTGKLELVNWKAAPLSMDEWHKFHAVHPEADALAIVSRPGLSADRNQALAYVEFACGDWCGGGHYFLMHADGEAKWVIDQRYQSWDFSEMFAPPPVETPK